jgi:uncharacterized membrane protein
MLLSALNTMTNRLKKLISKVTIYSIITIIAIATVTSSGSYDLIDRIFIGWRNTSSNILDVRRDSGTAALLIIFLTITGIFLGKKSSSLGLLFCIAALIYPFFIEASFIFLGISWVLLFCPFMILAPYLFYFHVLQKKK